jgi:heat shock protein HtpX
VTAVVKTMRSVLVRALMAAVGVGCFLAYASGAYLTYRLLRVVWADRPSALGFVLLLMAMSLSLGYASYRFGTRRLVGSLGTVDPPAERAAAFRRRLQELCARMDLEEPTVLFTGLEAPNAFAVGGPDGGVVVFGVSLFSLLDDDELAAILAHELAHLEGRDGLLQTLAFTGIQTVMTVVSLALLPVMLLLAGVAKATTWFRGRASTWSGSVAWRFRSLVVALVTVFPAVCTFVLLDRSRRLEYAADRRAATITDPLALARALRVVDDAPTEALRLQGLLPEESPPDPLYRLLSTHPETDERVARLESLAAR